MRDELAQVAGEDPARSSRRGVVRLARAAVAAEGRA